jgi:hypothetical protein
MFLLKRLSEKDPGLDLYLYNSQVPDTEWLTEAQKLAQICLIDTETAPENMQFSVNCVKYSTTQELLDILWQNFQ